MGSETATFLDSQDYSRYYLKKYKKATEVKRRVVYTNNEIKDLMEK